MHHITATIITRNEERHIAACLNSLRGVADEIIVVDSHSTDSTAEICRSQGCRVVERRLAGYGAQRQYATSLASNDYILTLDADEELSPSLARSLTALKEQGFRHRVYSFTRLNFFCGKPIRRCGWYPDVQIRLFDRRYANWNLRDVAESVIFRDSVRPEPVDGDILHYRCETPGEYSATMRHQAMLRSKVIAVSDQGLGMMAPLCHALLEWARCFFVKGGMLEGREGRCISRETFSSTLLAYKLARKIRKE